MARKAKYTQALPVYVTPEDRARVLRMAEEYEVSQAEVVRFCFARGISEAEEKWPPRS